LGVAVEFVLERTGEAEGVFHEAPGPSCRRGDRGREAGRPGFAGRAAARAALTRHRAIAGGVLGAGLEVR